MHGIGTPAHPSASPIEGVPWVVVGLRLAAWACCGWGWEGGISQPPPPAPLTGCCRNTRATLRVRFAVLDSLFCKLSNKPKLASWLAGVTELWPFECRLVHLAATPPEHKGGEGGHVGGPKVLRSRPRRAGRDGRGLDPAASPSAGLETGFQSRGHVHASHQPPADGKRRCSHAESHQPDQRGLGSVGWAPVTSPPTKKQSNPKGPTLRPQP